MKGYDISTWNKTFNKTDLDFLLIRVGYSHTEDKMFKTFYDRYNGKTKLGLYYYAMCQGIDGTKEAEYCLSFIGNRTNFNLPIYYDLEDKSLTNIRENAQKFINRIRQAGFRAGIYANMSWYAQYDLESLDSDSNWVAYYGKTDDGTMASTKPTTPKKWDIWQYTSNPLDTDYAENLDNIICHNSPVNSQISPVKSVQNWLNANYYTQIAEDGIYGRLTKKALVVALQTELNRQFNADLIIDGIFGVNTKAKCVIVRKGNSGNITKILQAALICNGYSTNGFDGIFGDGTEKAVKSYQLHHNLIVDGIAGRNTFSSLLQ